MAYKDKEKEKDFKNAYYQAHKEEMKARAKAWYQAHRDEKKARNKAFYQAHKDDKRSIANAYYQAHKDEKKAYQKSETNSLGHTKQSIRTKSRYYLLNVLKHTNMSGYEIHHCFGYDDYKCFIYIPKELHLQIHQYLRDNGISADTDHYSKIAHLVVAWEGYVFIKD